MRFELPRVLLVGLGPTTRFALDGLAGECRVVGLVRPIDGCPDETHARATRLDVPVFPDASLEAIGGLVDRLRPDCVVVSSHNRVFPAALVGKSRFVNVHYAPLPGYRGRATVNWAILNGEPETAITIHVLSPDLDAGDILFQRAVPIGPADTVGALYEKLNALQQAHLGRTVRRYLAGEPGVPQDPAGVTYCCTRLPEDGQIDWTASAKRVCDLVRALTPPFPGAFTFLNGRRLRVWRAELPPPGPPFAGRVPGRVTGLTKSQGFVDVLAGDGPVRLFEVELDGEGRRPAAAVIGSTKVTLGLRLTDLLARIEDLERRLAAAEVGGK